MPLPAKIAVMFVVVAVVIFLWRSLRFKNPYVHDITQEADEKPKVSRPHA